MSLDRSFCSETVSYLLTDPIPSFIGSIDFNRTFRLKLRELSQVFPPIVSALQHCTKVRQYTASIQEKALWAIVRRTAIIQTEHLVAT